MTAPQKYHQKEAKMKPKYLSQDEILPKVDQRIIELQQIIANLQKQLKKVPKESLRIVQRRNNFFYYLITSPKDTNGKYLPKAQSKLARQIAQRDYNFAIKREIEGELKVLYKLKKNYRPQNLINIYKRLTLGRKQLVTPVQLPNEEFAKQWQAQSNPGDSFNSQNKCFQTNCGIFVRSKSEVLIADALTNHNIPFHYEMPLHLKDKAFYPDFTCLHPSTRKVYIWEHFGLIDQSEYAIHALEKLILYQSKHFIQSHTLIITYETLDHPLTPQKIHTLIQEYFSC